MRTLSTRWLALVLAAAPTAALADTFGAESLWHGDVARLGGAANVRMADVNADGRDDLVTFYRSQWGTGSPAGDVMVSLSTGTAFSTPVRWHSSLCNNSETCAVGDFNGDGRADAASFLGGSIADVRVALSTGTSFGATGTWHTNFAPSPELPRWATSTATAATTSSASPWASRMT
jgi:hypothetical protein